MRDELKLILAALLVPGAVSFAYGNHFHNGFYFDDSHVIVNNAAIRQIENIPSFFADIETVSTLPANRSYRPMLTVLNAIDYWIGGELDPFHFHVSIFACYLAQLALMFVLFRRIFDLAAPHRLNAWAALLGTAFYGLHTANAETLNLIGARTDSFSTLCIVASLVLFGISSTRRRFVYLIPAVLAMFTKQTGAMLAPLVLLYVAFFEEGVLLPGQPTSFQRSKLYEVARKSLPVFIVCGGLLLFAQVVMTPESTVSFNARADRFDYLMTQAFVVAHYLGNFVLPVRLSVDPDFVVLTEPLDARIILGVVVIGALLFVGVITAARSRTRPISFGIFWFFVALAPTSSLVPLFQVANDHRTFFPFVGLALSLAWLARLIGEQFESPNDRWPRAAILAIVAAVMAGHVFGTRQRNEVWSSAETLWHDATLKSPGNGRAKMNYGLTQMRKGRYEKALAQFEEALPLLPRWGILHVNLGVVYEALGRREQADEHYRSALRFGRRDPSVLYHSAKWARDRGRLNEAIDLLERGAELSPHNANFQTLLGQIRLDQAGSDQERLVLLTDLIRANPSASRYVDLSLVYYRMERFDDAIAAAKEALALEPASATAYNNICSAEARLERWEAAVRACEAALEHSPNFSRARANLEWAKQGLANQ